MQKSNKTLLWVVALMLVAGISAISVLAGNEKEQNLSLSDVPDAVRATIEKHAADAQIKEIELEDENGKQLYEVEIMQNGQEKDFKVALDGTFLGYEDEDEQLVSLSELSAAVRATIEKHAAGAEIKEIELEKEHGKQLYEVEIMQNGQEKEFQVALDGTFLGYEEEDEEEDEDEEEEEQEVPYDSLPAPVKAAVEKYFGGAQDFEVEKEQEYGITVYEVEGEKDGTELSVELTEAGEILEIEKEIPASQLPAAATAQINQQFPGATIKEVTLVKRFSYEVELTVNGKTKELMVCPSGKVKEEHED